MEEGTSVLVVDDDDTIREYLTEVIERMGYTVSAAANGIKALEYLRNHPNPDLILLDVIMPGMTGIEVLRTIKEDPDLAACLVIMVTGVHHIAEKELAFVLGASDYLEKPFETRELIARVRTHINLKKATEKVLLQKKVQETILSTIPGIVYLKNRDGTYIHGNEMFASLTGRPIEEIAGKGEEDIFDTRTATERKQTDELILQLGVPEIEIQEEIQNQDGNARYFFTRKRPVYNESHDIVGIVGVSIDITEQVILKEAYYEAEELLTAVLNTHPAEIWVMGPSGEMILQNNHHLSKYGNLIGRNIKEWPVPEKILRDWKAGFDSVVTPNHQGVHSRESEYSGDGNMLLVSPVRTDEKLLGVMGMSLDLARWAVYAASAGLTSDHAVNLLEPVPLIIVGVGMNQIYFANKTARETCAIKPDHPSQGIPYDTPVSVMKGNRIEPYREPWEVTVSGVVYAAIRVGEMNMHEHQVELFILSLGDPDGA
jgi:PAS domain S-box-containing protein